MSGYQYYANLTPGPVSHHNHHGRRRGGPPKLSMGPNSQKQQHHHHHHQSQQQQMLRNQARILREAPEPEPAPTVGMMAYMESLEQWISFDLDDDIEFCPNLVSESDMASLSSASERSSLASGSPDASPTQQPQTVATGFLHTFHPGFLPPAFSPHQALPIHQPAATRAIAIIDPTTGVPVSSPSPSVSPNRLPRSMGRW